jgi:hypothetical protein
LWGDDNKIDIGDNFYIANVLQITGSIPLHKEFLDDALLLLAQLMLMTGLLVPGQSDNAKNNNRIGAYYYF